MKTLKDALIGETVVVKKISGEPVLKRRLMDMGITKDCKIYIRKVAPLGDPFEITVRGYELSVRKDDASCVEIC
ncbi:MAG: ferrous iron transport protein A [Treponema sp.]|nr:ferrous iron transport protein A [Treponema sp.]